MNLFEHNFFNDFGYTLQKHKHIDFSDVFSKGQMASKLWVIRELKGYGIHDLGVVFLCAGWYGLLGRMILDDKTLKCLKIRSFDIDDESTEVAESLNRSFVMNNWIFKATTQNIHDIDYDGHKYTTRRANGSEVELNDEPDTIINTSCEHIEDFDAWYEKIPKGKLLILQNNNYVEIPEHVNCERSCEDFMKRCPMTRVLYHGTLVNESYARFMIIGYR